MSLRAFKAWRERLISSMDSRSWFDDEDLPAEVGLERLVISRPAYGNVSSKTITYSAASVLSAIDAEMKERTA